MFKNKVIVVIGGAGFIGSHIIDKCLELDAEKVYCVDNFTIGTTKNIRHLTTHPRFHLIDKSMFNITLQSIIDEADIIFQEACSKLVVGLKKPVLNTRVNVLGNLNILEMIRKSYNNPRIIYASTGSVFGSSDRPFKEDDKKKPSTIYGISKLAVEHFYKLYYRDYGIKSSILRYFHVYGERQEYRGGAGVINIFLSQVLQGKKPTVCKPGNQIRCFTYVLDDVAANFILCKNNCSIGEDYNVASDLRISVIELANMILNKYAEKNNGFQLIESRKGENMKPIPDTSKIKALGFKAKMPFSKGLDLTAKWVKKDLKWQVSRL